MSIKSHAAHYKTLSRHYMTPEQVDDAPIPPPDAEKTALYHTAHALVSERHAKSDLDGFNVYSLDSLGRGDCCVCITLWLTYHLLIVLISRATARQNKIA